ncbi:MAG: hypothetical protein AAGF56_02055 [Pseudomonadota bacterium]
MKINLRLVFRWTAFLLAGGYCIRMMFFSDWTAFGGPFRFLTVWALFCSFFCFSRMMAIEEGRSTRRWDGFVSMTAVLNTMVVFLYWRLFLADPTSVSQSGALGALYLELYLHGLGPALQIVDALFVHRAFRRPGAAVAWLFGVISAFLLWSELVLQPLNTTPAGTVTSGLPYPFLNNLEWADRALFYGSNFAVALVILVIFTGIARLIRRRFPVPAAP